jgi:hypothetical protein
LIYVQKGVVLKAGKKAGLEKLTQEGLMDTGITSRNPFSGKLDPILANMFSTLVNKFDIHFQ